MDYTDDIQVVSIANPKELKNFLFVCLAKDKTKNRKNSCYYSVFNDLGEQVEIVFLKNKGKKEQTVEKVVSSFHSSDKLKLMNALNLDDNNFMTLKKAQELKYFKSRENPLNVYKKCHCLKKIKVVAEADKCEEDKCDKPKKVFLVNGVSYYNKKN